MTDQPEVNEDYSCRIAELVRLIDALPADRQERLRCELEAGTLDIEKLRDMAGA